ncbi:MAG: hypothetical protein Q7U47_06870 [Paludibacter sp.]|nr:hypothetical protein [Paludibacter sp.]
MEQANEYHQFNDKQLAVLSFLKNMRQYSPENFNYLIFYGASAREMIKFIEQPEKYGDFDFTLVCGLFRAIDKTFRYLIECPKIETQTEEDRVLTAILMYSDNAFKSIYTSERLINKSHLMAYLKREEVIYNWNGWLLGIVQKQVEEIKAEMRLKFEFAG